MKRLVVVLGLLGLAAVDMGCVIDLGSRESVSMLPPRKTAVVIDGEVYIVDLKKGTKRRVEAAAVDAMTVTTVTEETASPETDTVP
ncbi:MAG: hypothetical protein ACE5E6_07245 [Phycisphaerae bacterium]